MKFHLFFSLLLFTALLNGQTRYDVSSQTEFNSAQDLASAGDTIVWEPGVYSSTRMDIDKDGIIVTAEPYGSVLFKGVSRAVIDADDVTFAGFQYVGGFIGNLHVLQVFGSNVLITHVNIQNYTSYKYLIMDEVCRNNTISYCNFENRINLDDQNILSILVDDEPGYHKIQHCSFKNFVGIGADQGIEPIRIGVSSQGHLDSRTLVENCYFTQCSGDGEIISHKSRQNVYRYNTFENNPVSELVLRHGDEGIVYGNFFLNNRGGVRIREGSDHFIFNNYFDGVHRRAMYLMNDPVDPLTNVHIYHNTFVNSRELVLGGDGNNPPTNVVIANNVFASPQEELFLDATGSETWNGNISFGDLGIDAPTSGLSNIDPQLFENIEGFFQPESNSPLIAAASDDYPAVPLYPGMDYDNDIALDIMKASRPMSASGRAIGASEFSSSINVQPHATEMNTGPSYLFDNPVNYVAANKSQLYITKEGDVRAVMVSSNVDWTVMNDADWISMNLTSGSGNAQLVLTIDENEVNVNRSATITISDGGTETVTVIVYQDPGDLVNVLDNTESNEVLLFPNPTNGKIKLSNLPSANSNSIIELINLDGRTVFSQAYQIQDHELELDLEKVVAGTYLLNIKIISPSGAIEAELTQTITKY